MKTQDRSQLHSRKIWEYMLLEMKILYKLNLNSVLAEIWEQWSHVKEKKPTKPTQATILIPVNSSHGV